MLQNMLAKMASRLGKSDDSMPEDEMDMMDAESSGPGDEEKDKRFKSGAIVAEFRPKLQEALRKKDPEKYDAFINTIAQMRKEGGELLKQGKIEEGKKKMMEANDYAQKSDLDTYLTQDEIKSVLKDDYDTYMQAFMDVMREPGQYPIKRFSGQKEQGTVEGLKDMKFGKRLATMPISVGYESNVGGGTFYKYNPKSKTVEVDKGRNK